MRQQKGHVRRVGDHWRLYYRESRVVDGKVCRVLLNVPLCAVDAEHRSKPSVKSLADDKMKTVNDQQRNVSPETFLKLTDFVTNVYLPFTKSNKRLSTYQGYRRAWNEYLEPRVGNVWLRKVRTCDIQRLLNEVAAGHDVSRITLRHVKALLSGIFSHAKQQGYFDGVNPVRDAAIPKAKDGGETYAYSLEEVRQMIALLPDPAATIVAIAAYTRLRRSEIRGLRWEDYRDVEVHDGAKVEKIRALQVSQSIWNGIANEPKTRASAAPVPVIAPLRLMLDMHNLRKGEPKSGPMFPNENNKAADLNNLSNRVIVPALRVCSVCKNAKGVPHAGAKHEFQLDESRPQWRGWHAFRRGLGTNLYRLGVPDKTIQMILRHANVSTTMTYYVKGVPADSIKAMATFEQTAEAVPLPECYNQSSRPVGALLS